jgi:hypothetical protein
MLMVLAGMRHRHFTCKNKTTLRGFSAVEVAIILPIAVFVVLALLSMSIRLINDSSGQNVLTKRMADIQVTLDRIEQDISLSNNYLAVSLIGGHTSNKSCDYNDETFDDAGSHFKPFKIVGQGEYKTLILQSLMTTDNPLTEDTTKNLVHISYNPHDECSLNPPLFSNTIYFIKNNTLYRRVMFPDNVEYPEVASLVGTRVNCETPWQRPTCGQSISSITNFYPDTRLLDDAEMEIEFFDPAEPNTPLTDIFSSSLNDGERQNALDRAVTVHITLKSEVTAIEGDKPTTISGQLRANRIP